MKKRTAKSPLSIAAAEASKPLTIVLGINSLVATRHIAYSNHIQLMFRLGRNYPHNFILHNPSRMSIDRFRNMTAQTALENDADYVLFLDDDVLVPFDCLTKLLAMDADIASADVCVRGYPFNHMLFRKGRTKSTRGGLYPMAKLPSPRGVIDVDAVGCSLTLIKTSLFKKVPPPFFVTGPTTNTEDIYFCCKARHVDPETTIKADTSIICQHILWEESIGSNNKAAFKRYHEALFGKPKPNEADWRGDVYLTDARKVVEVAANGHA